MLQVFTVYIKSLLFKEIVAFLGAILKIKEVLADLSLDQIFHLKQ
jgi:hypothetical protein